MNKRLLGSTGWSLQEDSAKAIVVGRGKGHPQQGTGSACMLLSCLLEGLAGVSTAAICMPSPHISLWAAGPKLHSPNRGNLLFMLITVPCRGFFLCSSAECDSAVYLCESVSQRKCTDWCWGMIESAWLRFTQLPLSGPAISPDFL